VTFAAGRRLKFMGVLPHPDDESLGIGGALAKYAGEGVETSLVTATRSERARFGEKGEKAGLCCAKIFAVSSPELSSV
jgi:LmbE family N-acetylglucosaminyl deacetylase